MYFLLSYFFLFDFIITMDFPDFLHRCGCRMFELDMMFDDELCHDEDVVCLVHFKLYGTK
jgi:hypothetical protein